MSMKKRPTITRIRPAGLNKVGQDHQVVTVTGGHGTYRREPCPTCPWRVDTVGEFPGEAFRHSAPTAYDMAVETFACHESGSAKPAVCAGFLLRGAFHNMAVRLGFSSGRFKNDFSDGGHELHADYRAMAVANGVDPDDPVLKACRGNGY